MYYFVIFFPFSVLVSFIISLFQKQLSSLVEEDHVKTSSSPSIKENRPELKTRN